MVTMDWLAKMCGLPEVFLHTTEGNGGGVIQGSASESTLVSLLAAKYRKIKQLEKEGVNIEGLESKLVAYMSMQAHSSIEKGIKIVGSKIRALDTNSSFSLKGDTLRKAIEEDKANGLVPYFVGASFGTTSVRLVN